jgi:hypothetical protein
MIISQFPANGGSGGALPQFSYDGQYSVILDSGGWKVKFLTSGTLTMKSGANVDVFLVGGGGTGRGYTRQQTSDQQGGQYYQTTYGGGGGSGYTVTEKAVTLIANHEYNIVIGQAGGASSFEADLSDEAETISYTALAGENASPTSGGDGGSGGSGSGYYMTYLNGSYYAGQREVRGGTDGGNAERRYGTPGTGQGTTTREFGEPSGELYASGGGSYYSYTEAPAVIPNTGNGGTGGNRGIGASGIVIIRNAR